MTSRRFDPFDQPGGGLDHQADERAAAHRPAVSVGEAIEAMVRRRRWSSRVQGARIHEVWGEVAGAAVAANVWPVRLQGGVLVLAAADPTWVTEVHYLGSQLVARANDALGVALVERVVVQVDARPGGARPNSP